MKLLLVCNAGMSTGILQMKLEEVAKEKNIDAVVEAVPMGELSEYSDDADVILLGPQIRFALDDVKKTMPDKPVIVINVQDFGMMRADRIFDQVMELLPK